MSGIWQSVQDVLVAALAALGLGGPGPDVWNGYLEADYLYVAPLSAGRITAIHADEGQRVAAGEVLVEMETAAQSAALAVARAGVAQARANLDNLATGGREAEIAVVAAMLRRAEAERHLAQANLERTQALSARGAASDVQLQRDSAALESAAALEAELQARLDVARLPARAAQRLAAEAALEGAQAQQAQAQIALDDRSLRAPADGLVDHRFYDPGEVAGAGAPVLSLYDPARLRVIFFVPEARRADLALGQELAIGCDSCPPGLVATLMRIGAEPQFTPPILYSRDERGRLVFRAEALLGENPGLSPGQPVSLRPAARP